MRHPDQRKEARARHQGEETAAAGAVKDTAAACITGNLSRSSLSNGWGASSKNSADNKILILFDMNGVLTDHTPAKGRFRERGHVIRPHIEELLRLLPHFRLGIYSSATWRTVDTALALLHQTLKHKAAQTGRGHIVSLTQSHAMQSSNDWWCGGDVLDGLSGGKRCWLLVVTVVMLAADGVMLLLWRPWRRTVLVDNDAYKSAEGEEGSMLLVPHWENDPVSNRDFAILVPLLLSCLKKVPGDVRPHLPQVRQVLLKLRQLELPLPEPATAAEAAAGGRQAGDNNNIPDDDGDSRVGGVNDSGPSEPKERRMRRRRNQEQQEVEIDLAANEDDAAMEELTLMAELQEEQEQVVSSSSAQAEVPVEVPIELPNEQPVTKDMAWLGFKADVDVAAAPEPVRQLVQLLDQFRQDGGGSGGSGSSTGDAGVDLQVLLQCHEPPVPDGEMQKLQARYQHHLKTVLLAAVQAAVDVCLPRWRERLQQQGPLAAATTDTFLGQMCCMLLWVMRELASTRGVTVDQLEAALLEGQLRGGEDQDAIDAAAAPDLVSGSNSDSESEDEDEDDGEDDGEGEYDMEEEQQEEEEEEEEEEEGDEGWETDDELDGGLQLGMHCERVEVCVCGGGGGVLKVAGQATGLALPGSDLDLVLLGVPCPPTASATEGYKMKDRATIKNMLQRLRKQMGTSGLAFPRGSGAGGSSGVRHFSLPIDISIGVANGVSAIQFMNRQRFSGAAGGGCFDFAKEAVSVAAGGIIDKRPSWVKVQKPGLLAVEDPQQAGRDIASGSYNVTGVQEAFAWAADSLRRLAQGQSRSVAVPAAPAGEDMEQERLQIEQQQPTGVKLAGGKLSKQQRRDLRKQFKGAGLKEIRQMPPDLALLVGQGKLKRSEAKHLRNLQRMQDGLHTRRGAHQARALWRQQQGLPDPQGKKQGKKQPKAKKARRTDSGGSGAGGGQGQRHTPKKRQKQQQQQEQAGFDSSASGSSKKRRKGYGDSGEGGGGRGWGYE
eukprot:gene2545-2848_t